MTSAESTRGSSLDCICKMANTEEVCKFLRERGLEDEVIEKVKEEKMNEKAISLASDEFLKELGIVAKGDILSLRAFVNHKIHDTESFDGESREQRKRMLIEKLLDGRKKFGGSDSSSFKGKNTKVTKESVKEIKTRKVKLAWQHFNEDSRRYVMVREATGGGQREMSLPCNSDYSEVLSILTNLFFPNGKSSRGQVSEMELCLGSFKCEVIGEEGFTVGDYISVNKLSKPRIYLPSKAKSHAKDQENSTDRMDDDVLFRPVFSSTPVQDEHSPHVKDAYNSSDDEVVFKGQYGLHEDEGSLLLGETLVVVTEGDDVQHSFRVKEELPVSLLKKCEICQGEIKGTDLSAHPAGCLDMFHKFCLREWLKTGDGSSIKCPVCRIDFTEIQSGSSLEPAGDEMLEDVQVQATASPAIQATASPAIQSSGSRGYFFRQYYLPQLLCDEVIKKGM